MAKEYSVSDIQTLEGIEAIRLRPGMYIGSIGPQGVRHITLEIISNAVDEYLNGHCTQCEVKVDDRGWIVVKDNGRGVPFGAQEDGSETLENIFTKLHTGAKFDSTGKTGYNTSGGMNGIGAKATNALSSEFEVVSCRDGKKAHMTFKKGERTNFTVIDSKDSQGTEIRFLPDKSIFKEGIELEYAPLKKQLQELSFLTPGMKFILTHTSNQKEEICSKDGLVDYVKHLNNGKLGLTSIFTAEAFEERIGVKVALMYTDQYSDINRLYTNAIPNSRGTHLTGFRTALTMSINAYAKSKGLLKEKEPNFTTEDLKEGLILTLALVMPDPVFDGQTKDELTSSEGRTIVQRLMSQELKLWLESHEKDAKAIIAKAALARKARENARKARENVRQAATKHSRVLLPGKLTDCTSSNRRECELFVVEGDSAAGPAKSGRDRHTQAVYPIRGKIINTFKADLNKIMKNDIVGALLSAIGLSTDGTKVVMDESKLRYGKIIIAADADVDGSHIRVLFLTFIWKFAPDLIKKGYVYSAVPPLFKVVQGTKFTYLQSETELEDYKAKAGSRKFQVMRNKGLGEMDVHELAETVMSSETRTLKRITVDDVQQAEAMFRALMGDDTVPRKVFIENNAMYADIDV